MDDRVSRAQQAIADVLKALEAETGRKVDQIEVRRVDVTRFQDERCNVLKQVAITLQPDRDEVWN